MWNNKKCFPLCQTYKPTTIQNYISKRWPNIQEASDLSTAHNVVQWEVISHQCHKGNDGAAKPQ